MLYCTVKYLPMTTVAKMNLRHIGSPHFTLVGFVVVRLNSVIFVGCQGGIFQNPAASIAISSQTGGCLIGQIKGCGVTDSSTSLIVGLVDSIVVVIIIVIGDATVLTRPQVASRAAIAMAVSVHVFNIGTVNCSVFSCF